MQEQTNYPDSVDEEKPVDQEPAAAEPSNAPTSGQMSTEKEPSIENAADMSSRPASDRRKEPKERSTSGTLAIAVLASVILLAGAGYFFLQQLREKQEGLGGRLHQENQQILEMNKQLGTFQSQLATFQSQLVNLQNELASRDNRLDKALADFAQRHDEKLGTTKAELSEAVLRLQRQLGKTRGDWLIADAEYLLSVANERLQLVGDVSTAITALEAADQRLRESGDPAVFKVREAIAAEIAKLKQVSPPDVVGTFAKLQTIEAKADDLPLFLPHAGETMRQSEKTPEEGEGKVEGVEGLVDSALRDLKDLIDIRRTDRPMDRVLLPAEVEVIRQQLRTNLEIAKLALVQHNSELFRRSLDSAREWLIENYQPNADLNGVLAELKQLRDVAVSAKLPEIGTSLKMLREISKLRIETDKALEERTRPAPEGVQPKAETPQPIPQTEQP